MRFAALIIVLFAESAFAQLVIKGHKTGDSATDFIAKEPTIQAKLTACHSNKPRAISVEEVKHMKVENKKYYEQMASQGRLFNQNVEAYNRECGTVLSIFDSNGTGEVFISGDTSSPTWKFDAGKIAGLMMSPMDVYDRVRIDLAQRIGSQPDERAIPYHNGFGATWTTRYAEWATRDEYVELMESNDPAKSDKRPVLIVKTRSEHDAELKASEQKKSSLD